jgi:hypothetical protein
MKGNPPPETILPAEFPILQKPPRYRNLIKIRA